ncbi:transcriptional regulator [Pseudomonas putida]|uniref:helix-turn-helix domain-containing protein n=1 Tax=Pseudomonas putida TaxID=303 RepID=UPI0018AAE674|nr:transcriptional regulator [Pseudomonas putida]MBF8651961.1 transcriptional regulator [Pseudomonas putida]MBF8655913.1 transcriptional regulator [Pseudomonas putida]
MTTVLENSQSVRAALENLQMLLEQLRGQYVNGIEGPEDYARATVLLDELTDGHDLNKYEEQILIELEDAISAYEQKGEQLKAFNDSIKANTTPVQLIKDLMQTLGLTGSDLPEIGDKFVVSKVLNGDRAISSRMAFALAKRFHMDPKSFVSDTARPSGRPSLKVHTTPGKSECKSKSKMSYKMVVKRPPVNFVYTVHPMPDDQRLAASSKRAPARPRPAKS